MDSSPDPTTASTVLLGGEELFTWMSAGPGSNRLERGLAPPDASKVGMDEWMAEAGALIAGRRTSTSRTGGRRAIRSTYRSSWVTHRAPTHGEWSPRVSFVTEGVQLALELAMEAAGDRTVSVSGADVAQQLLRAGRIDEIQGSVAPLLLGAGVRLFDHLDPDPIVLEQTRVIGSEGVTHLRYRVVRG